MIDLNPAHDSRNMIKPPPEASPEEYHCQWYQITDKISYLPGVKGQVHFKSCFHDLHNGVQVHVLAPMGLDIKQKWTLAGNLPGEPVQPPEIGIGAPVSGLYLREDVEIKCNIMVTRFVKKQLKDALKTLVDRLLVKSQLQEAVAANQRLIHDNSQYAQHPPTPNVAELSTPGMNTYGGHSPPMSPPLSPATSPIKSMSLMSQAVRSSAILQNQLQTPQQPNSAPLQGQQRPEWAQGAPSPPLGIKMQHRSSLPPLPNYNPADYAPVQAVEMDANQRYAQQHKQWQQQYGPPSGYAELQ
ncbi:hypothetical protein B0O99DRAFT_607650 [Bisporella sp. PMI_857]|nr:hypothetical protein B0O99DRAFT_607650 [Bisporella sp. PMI_857]